MKQNSTLLRVTIFLIAAVLITLILPHQGKLLADFKVGETWSHETMQAPFDIPIYRNTSDVMRDRREVEEKFIPVFSCNGELGEDHLRALYADFGLPDSVQVQLEIPGAVISAYPMTPRQAVAAFVARNLKQIYRKGIIQDPHTSMQDVNGVQLIRVNRNSILTTVSSSEVYTPTEVRMVIAKVLASMSAKESNLVVADFDRYIVPTVLYDDAINIRLKEREMNNVSRTQGMIQHNDVIVAHNQLIDNAVYGRLNSLKIAYEEQGNLPQRGIFVLLGYFLVVSLILGVTYIFLIYLRTEFVHKIRDILFVLILFIAMVALCVAVNRTGWLSIYTIPFAIVPIYIMTFYTVRLPIFEFAAVLFLCALSVYKPLEFIVTNFMAGMVCLFVLRNYYRRERIFLATGAMLVTYALGYTALSLIQSGSFAQVDWWTFVWFVVNALLFLGLYQLTYIIEKVFGFVSDITLLELCDTNQPLLLELAQKAPGTFQHALQVANLCGSAAKEIGANPLLARTGALYHDIGKMNNPEYFIENVANEFSPHAKLTPLESAEIIRKHVSDGIALARKERIPGVIIEFIEQHHGDSAIYYFYSVYRETHPDATIADFCYPGPKPVSREASICMIADAVEAASRTLSSYTEQSVENMVDKVVESQMKEHQFDNSKLSLHEIDLVKTVLKKKLINIYHTRIAYPER